MSLLSVLSASVLVGAIYGQSLDEYKCSFCLASVDTAKSSKSSLMSSCTTLFPKELCQTYQLDFELDSYVPPSREICVSHGLCDPTLRKPLSEDSAILDLRISKGYGSRGYDKIRISVISNETIESPLFTYSEEFRYRWTDNVLNSGVVSVTPGEKNTFSVGDESFDVFIPALGEGSRGVLIADPCFTSEFITCLYGKEFNMFNHTIELLNAINEYDDNHYWMILGDNFYDQSGEPTAEWFGALSLASKTKVMASVPGNHDFWVNASPKLWTPKDQLGNGFMQWYAQDVAAAFSNEAAGKSDPFDFSIDPDSERADAYSIPSLSNFFWYNMMGNTGFIGYSGAHSYEDTLPYIEEACTWAVDQGDKLGTLVLLGHWNTDGDGCQADMTVSAMFENMKANPSCSAVASKMKYFVGHQHCNMVMEENTGFMIGGQGMSDVKCGGDFGIPVLDTTGGRFKVYFFPIQQHRGYTYYQDTLQCIKSNGISGCYHLATVWADEPL